MNKDANRHVASTSRTSSQLRESVSRDDKAKRCAAAATWHVTAHVNAHFIIKLVEIQMEGYTQDMICDLMHRP